jgi:hypothetical protein
VARGKQFQYVIVRIVPRVERGERLNAGVVVYSPPLEFLGARVRLDEDRLLALAPGCDGDAVRPYLEAIEAIAAGDPAGGPISRFDRGERFHWLAAPSSTMVQPSPIHTGLTGDPRCMLDHLFQQLVLPDGAA